MHFYVKTPSGDYAYDTVELSASDATKFAAFQTRLAALRAWLDSNQSTKVSALSGAALIAFNAIKTFIQSTGAQAVAAHVLQRGGTPGNPTQIPLAGATYACMWDGRSPYVVSLLKTFDPFAAVSVPTYDPVTRLQNGTTMQAPGIPFAGWPQTDVIPDPPTPPTQAQIDAANAAAAAKQAAQDQWRLDAQAQMQLGIPIYQAWVQSNPYPA